MSAVTEEDVTFPVTLTDKAARKVSELLGREDRDDLMLRVSVVNS